MKYNVRNYCVSVVVLVLICASVLSGCNVADSRDEGTNLAELNEDRNENNDKHSDDYYILWAVPEGSINISEENIEKLNEKLEKDGYDFGLRFVYLEESTEPDKYINQLLTSKADIIHTGHEWYGMNNAERLMAEGRLEDITGLLEGSNFFSRMNPLIKESITYNGKIYLLPNEMAQDGEKLTIMSCLQNDIYDAKIKENILKLEDIVTEENKLFCGWTGFDFVRCFGYDYDDVRGIVVTTEGKIINPLEDEKCLEWMKLVNNWYRDGLAYYENSDEKKKLCSFFLTYSISNNTDNKLREISSYEVKLCKRFKRSTGILASSEKKDKAFKLLELLRSEHDYGNLLIYGHMEKIGDNPESSAYNTKVVLGLDDGLLGSEEALGMKHFMTLEERNSFYDENVNASATLYMNLPLDCSELNEIVKKYLGYDSSILFVDDFEEKLEMFIREYTDKLEEIKKELEK